MEGYHKETTLDHTCSEEIERTRAAESRRKDVNVVDFNVFNNVHMFLPIGVSLD